MVKRYDIATRLRVTEQADGLYVLASDYEALAAAARKVCDNQRDVCPSPLVSDNGTASDCIAKGHCGCDEKDTAALRALLPKEPT